MSNIKRIVLHEVVCLINNPEPGFPLNKDMKYFVAKVDKNNDCNLIFTQDFSRWYNITPFDRDRTFSAWTIPAAGGYYKAKDIFKYTNRSIIINKFNFSVIRFSKHGNHNTLIESIISM